jgi:energy-converting hydrogenase Eha subunit C
VNKSLSLAYVCGQMVDVVSGLNLLGFAVIRILFADAEPICSVIIALILFNFTVKKKMRKCFFYPELKWLTAALFPLITFLPPGASIVLEYG